MGRGEGASNKMEGEGGKGGEERRGRRERRGGRGKEEEGEIWERRRAFESEGDFHFPN